MPKSNSLCTGGGAKSYASSAVIDFCTGLMKKNFFFMHRILTLCMNQPQQCGVCISALPAVYKEFLFSPHGEKKDGKNLKELFQIPLEFIRRSECRGRSLFAGRPGKLPSPQGKPPGFSPFGKVTYHVQQNYRSCQLQLHFSSSTSGDLTLPTP